MSAIFVGYRRQDTADASGRIYDALVAAFGPKSVFKDVYSIPAGVDFGEHIRAVLRKCRVFIALIGPDWADVRDEDGKRRLDDPADWVRVEIETALSISDLQVVPVLVNGARLPDATDLPESLRPLVRRNAAIIRRDPDFPSDVERLVRGIEQGSSGSMWRRLRGRKRGPGPLIWVALAVVSFFAVSVSITPISTFTEIGGDIVESLGLRPTRIIVLTDDLVTTEVEVADALKAGNGAGEARASPRRDAALEAYEMQATTGNFGELLTSKIVASGHLTVVDQAQVRAALDQRNGGFLSVTFDPDPSDLKHIGRQLGTRLVLTTKIDRADISHRYIVAEGKVFVGLEASPQATYRLTDIRSGRIVTSGVARLSRPASARILVSSGTPVSDALASQNFKADLKNATREMEGLIVDQLASRVATEVGRATAGAGKRSTSASAQTP